MSIIDHYCNDFYSCDDDLSNDVKEVWGGLDAAEFGLDELDEAVGEDLDHRLRRQLVHGIVLSGMKELGVKNRSSWFRMKCVPCGVP